MYLKLPNQSPQPVSQSSFTVGRGRGFDLDLPGDANQILFTILNRDGENLLIPALEKIRVNGGNVSSPVVLKSCDRIEAKEFLAVVLDVHLSKEQDESSSSLARYFEILSQMGEHLKNPQSLRSGLDPVFRALTECAGAEVGYLVSDLEAGAGWDILACAGETADVEKRRTLLSDAVLNEAIKRRAPVYVESIVGHPWARRESIMGARVFSLACLPLVVGDRVLGCAYLYTQTPGKSIRGTALKEINVLATQIALLLASEAELRRARKENAALRSPERALKYEPSSPMRDLDEQVSKLAPTDLSVLVLGETGTGKELIARELHRRSKRSKGPFVAINCGAVPPSLIESTLFGHVKGAFTGAMRDAPGKFEQANGGTLFLDEIGDLPLELQVKLLRVLQEKTVEPVGSQQAIAVDFRVVAATHRELETLVQRELFRRDLYFRLKGASVRVLPLRERPDDISYLATYFLEKVGQGHRLSESAMARVLEHSWPGNVRELEQVMLRAAVFAKGAEVQPDDLELSTSLAGIYPDDPDTAVCDFKSLKEAQLTFTESYIKRSLAKHAGNRSKTAAQLGVSERTLYRFLSHDRGDRVV